jgi:hypothetical protein
VSADAAAQSGGPGADVNLVLDVSGSMDKPNRYPLLCEAVRRLVIGLGAEDWISVTLFTDRSETVFPFMPVGEVASDPEQIIRAMNESGLLFGPRTNLAPGLRLALDGFRSRARDRGRVRRTYILSDGELHDTPECETVLNGFRPQSIEVHVYGFGDGFNAVALKQLVSDQIGGTVKPIVDEEDIAETFAHVAEVNRRLVGHDAKLDAVFSPEVVCGDAWVFQPHGRYLGAIHDRHVELVIGGIEEGRWYSLLLEIRLPIGCEQIGIVEASWVSGAHRVSNQVDVRVVREAGVGITIEEVRRAVRALHVLRAENDVNAQIESYKARRELAVIENRDPELISILDKMIARLTDAPAGTKTSDIEHADHPGDRLRRRLKEAEAARKQLTDRERLMLDADPGTAIYGSDLSPGSLKGSDVRRGTVSVEYDLWAELAESVELTTDEHALIDVIVRTVRQYVVAGLDPARATSLVSEFSRQAGLPITIAHQIRRRLLEGG